MFKVDDRAILEETFLDEKERKIVIIRHAGIEEMKGGGEIEVYDVEDLDGVIERFTTDEYNRRLKEIESYPQSIELTISSTRRAINHLIARLDQQEGEDTNELKRLDEVMKEKKEKYRKLSEENPLPVNGVYDPINKRINPI